MAMHETNPALLPDLGSKVSTSKLLVVGAGGIGCELLKNLVLSGFKNITVIDLDTIDVTNLNRQFLFQRQHVGMSKSKVARQSVLEFAPDAKVEALHDSVMNSEYGVSFYKGFELVLNALDNRAARSHVNRMCLAADVPLVESGTAGYLGQVTVIRKTKTECYECQPKPHQKTFPGCTIRNTPSEPIHCIVWAKHLFNQLFGEADPDEDVSPDSEDPELAGGGDKPAADAKDDGNVKRINTRQWAVDNGYDAKMIFTKLFCDDIKYLLSMDKLWAKRRPPTPLDWDSLPENLPGSEGGAAAGEGGENVIHDQIPWSIKQCATVLADSVGKLKAKLAASDYKDHLAWDKDDEPAMDFVAACANIRAHIFDIPTKTRFDVKSMAGNIIPAIATTNAVIAGCIVMEALKVLDGKLDKCRTVYLTRKPNPRKKILVPCQLNAPNPKCYVCSEKHEIGLQLDLDKVTLKTLEDKVLKGSLSMVAPDAEIDGKGVILISSEEDNDTSQNDNKTLREMGIADGTILSCDDFLQDYNVKVIVYHNSDLKDGVEFELVGDLSQLQAKRSDGEENCKGDAEMVEVEENGKTEAKNGNGHTEENGSNGSAVKDGDRKRRADLASTTEVAAIPAKKVRVEAPIEDDDDDIVCLE